MATNQDIQSWLSANPNATDQQIASAMQQYGVSPTQIAQATGVPLSDVQSRYSAATGTGGNATINGGTSAQDYALANGGSGQFMDKGVNYGYINPSSNWNQNGNYADMGVTSDVYGAAQGVKPVGMQGFQASGMGSYVDPSLNARFGLTSGITQNDPSLRSALYTPDGREIAMYAPGQIPGKDAPSALDAGYAWRNGQLVADPSSQGGVFRGGMFYSNGGGAPVPMQAATADPAASAGGTSQGTPVASSASSAPWQATNGDITSWLSQHQGASDQQIAQAMQQYHVSPQQLAGAIGADPSYIQSRFNAAIGGGQNTTNTGSPGGLGGMGGMGGAGGVMGTLGGQAGGMANGGSVNGSPGGGAFGSVGGYGYFGTQNNPYLAGMAQNIARQSNLGLNDALNGIRSDAVATGNVGSSREGIAQGVAIGRSQDALQGNLSGLYGTAFEGQQNRGLQQYNTDTNAYLGNQGQQMNYGLGLGQQALTNQGQQLDFYNTQRQLDQNGVALGAQLYGMGQQQSWAPYQNASNIYGQFGGYGTQTGQNSQGGGGVGAVGGAIGGGVLANAMSNTGNGYGGYGGLGLGGNYGLKM